MLERLLKATSAQVRDHPQQATIRGAGGDVITIISKVGRRTVAKYQILTADWLATNRHPNPRWAQMKLITIRTGHYDGQPGGPCQAVRIREAQVSAIIKVLGKQKEAETS